MRGKRRKLTDAELRAAGVGTYGQLMHYNAVDLREDVLRAVAANAVRVSPETVAALLQAGWREQAVGAWYAVVSRDNYVHAHLLDALATTHGLYSVPPLIVAAVVTSGAKAIPALEAHERRARGYELTRAAVEYLREHAAAASQVPPPRAGAMDWLEALLTVAQRLQGAVQEGDDRKSGQTPS